MNPSPPGPPPAPLPPPGTPARGGTARVVGALLVLPALAGLAVSYVWPSLWTVWASFQRLSPVGGASSPAGSANYSHVAGEAATATAYALSLGLRPLLAVVVVAPLLAFAAHHAGKAGRWVTRVAVSIPMAAVAPAAVAAGWRLTRVQAGELATAAGAQAFVASVVWLSTFGVACGLGVTLFLATQRRTPDRRGATWPAGIAAGVVAALATVAVSLQTFTYPMLLTGGGPAKATVTPALALYSVGFRYADFGVAAAASTLLGLGVGGLGIVAAVVLLASRMRIRVAPATRTADVPRSPGSASVVVGWIATAVGLVGVLAIAGYGLWPWLSNLGGSPDTGPSTANLFTNTWLPPLLSTVVGVGVAAVAGYGIGALRPLGRFSELLLLPFAPWLLVGTAPLAVARFDTARSMGLVNSFLGLVPPVWLVVPALFIFTLLAAGQAEQRQAMLSDGVPPSAATRRTLLPALPMLALVAGATWLWQSQDALWPLLVATDTTYYTGPVQAFVQLAQQTAGRGSTSLAGVLPIPILVIAIVALAALQLLHLDRLSIHVGRNHPNPPPHKIPLPEGTAATSNP